MDEERSSRPFKIFLHFHISINGLFRCDSFKAWPFFKVLFIGSLASEISESDRSCAGRRKLHRVDTLHSNITIVTAKYIYLIEIL